MTAKQRLMIEQSEKREKINGLLAKETLEDADRAQLGELTTRSQQIEVELRAAIVAEGQDEMKMRGAHPDADAEGLELRSLFGRVSLNDYFAPAGSGVGITGAAKELNEALKLPLVGKGGGVAMPVEFLRAFTDTSANDGAEMQRPILQRLFGPGVLDALGVRMDSVPAGKTEWPLLTGTAAPGQVKEGTAVGAATSATFDFANLKPKRLTGNYEYTHEMAASVGGIEEALRRDLGDAIKSKMSDIILNGPAPTTNNPQNIQGLLTRLTGVDLATGEAVAADYGRLHSLGVDSIHAQMETEVMGVVGTTTYQHAAGVYITGSGESGSELLKRRSGGCVASSYIPAAASMKQSAILHAAGSNGGGAAMRGDSVAALWPTLELVRDIYTKASQGVVLTWIMLWDARTAFRAAAYKQIDIQVST